MIGFEEYVEGMMGWILFPQVDRMDASNRKGRGVELARRLPDQLALAVVNHRERPLQKISGEQIFSVGA